MGLRLAACAGAGNLRKKTRNSEIAIQGWGRSVWLGFVPRRKRSPVRLRLAAAASAGNLGKKARNPEMAMQEVAGRLIAKLE